MGKAHSDSDIEFGLGIDRQSPAAADSGLVLKGLNGGVHEIDPAMTFDTLNVMSDQQKAVKEALLARLELIEGGAGSFWILGGEPGTGKTHVATAFARSYVAKVKRGSVEQEGQERFFATTEGLGQEASREDVRSHAEGMLAQSAKDDVFIRLASDRRYRNNLNLSVVDLLQFMNNGGRFPVAKILTEIEAVKKECGILDVKTAIRNGDIEWSEPKQGWSLKNASWTFDIRHEQFSPDRHEKMIWIDGSGLQPGIEGAVKRAIKSPRGGLVIVDDLFVRHNSVDKIEDADINAFAELPRLAADLGMNVIVTTNFSSDEFLPRVRAMDSMGRTQRRLDQSLISTPFLGNESKFSRG